MAGVRSVPAFDVLLDQPPAVRMQLLAIVDAVSTTGPDRWRDTNSHDSMRGSCEHLHEARDKHEQMLYRLYLLWQRNDKRVVIVDGGAKPNSTALPDSSTPSTTTWPRWPPPPMAIQPPLRWPATLLARPSRPTRGVDLLYTRARSLGLQRLLA
jgi:hypothetical protein